MPRLSRAYLYLLTKRHCGPIGYALMMLALVQPPVAIAAEGSEYKQRRPNIADEVSVSAAMENASLPSDGLNVTTSTPDDDDGLSLYLANIRQLSLKIVYIIIGTVGVVDNLFVLFVFILFVKITQKVKTFVTLVKSLRYSPFGIMQNKKA